MQSGGCLSILRVFSSSIKAVISNSSPPYYFREQLLCFPFDLTTKHCHYQRYNFQTQNCLVPDFSGISKLSKEIDWHRGCHEYHVLSEHCFCPQSFPPWQRRSVMLRCRYGLALSALEQLKCFVLSVCLQFFKETKWIEASVNLISPTSIPVKTEAEPKLEQQDGKDERALPGYHLCAFL